MCSHYGATPSLSFVPHCVLALLHEALIVSLCLRSLPEQIGGVARSAEGVGAVGSGYRLLVSL